MGEAPTRLEAFSDVVFAIAITLLILEIKVPHVEHGLWAGLLARWPSYVAFLMSFVVILIMWVNHHELVSMVQRVNYPILFANGCVRKAYHTGRTVYLVATIVALFQPVVGLLINVSLWIL